MMTLVKIAYTSNSGNTEGISEHLEDAFEELELDVIREEADDIDEDFFDDADVAIIATFTDGDGELPEAFEDFYEELEDKDLDGKIFGVVGTGDSEIYPDAFCQAAFSFEKILLDSGGKKGVETLTIENEADDEDIEKFKSFAKKITETL